MEKRLHKVYPTYYNLLIITIYEYTYYNLWQAHYEILSIIFLNECIELNVNTDMMKKNVKLVELNKSIATVFSNI